MELYWTHIQQDNVLKCIINDSLHYICIEGGKIIQKVVDNQVVDIFTTELITSSARSAKFGPIITDGVIELDVNAYELPLCKQRINIEHNINFIIDSLIFI